MALFFIITKIINIISNIFIAIVIDLDFFIILRIILIKISILQIMLILIMLMIQLFKIIMVGVIIKFITFIDFGFRYFKGIIYFIVIIEQMVIVYYKLNFITINQRFKYFVMLQNIIEIMLTIQYQLTFHFEITYFNLFITKYQGMVYQWVVVFHQIIFNLIFLSFHQDFVIIRQAIMTFLSITIILVLVFHLFLIPRVYFEQQVSQMLFFREIDQLFFQFNLLELELGHQINFEEVQLWLDAHLQLA